MFSKRTLIRLGVSIVVVLLIAFTLPSFVYSAEGSLAESSWPKFRGDLQNTGMYEDGESEVLNHTRWNFQTKGVIDGPSTVGPNDIIYVGSHDGYLYSIEPDGSKRWKYNASSVISSGPAINDDGSIYFLTTDGGFYSLNEDGTENWVLEDLLEPESPLAGPVISSPVIREDGTILVASERVFSVYPNGTVEWRYEHIFEGEEHPSPGQVQSTPALDEEGNIYFGYSVHTPDGSLGLLIALDSDGEQLWEFGIRDDEGEWEFGAGILSSPAISEDGMIYFGSHNNKLYALEKEEGTEVWNYTTMDNIFSSPAIGPDGMVYVGSVDNNLYAINPDGSKGWHFETGGEVYSSPAIGPEGMIYFGSDDNYIYSLYPDGTERWRVETEDRVFSSPALGTEGSLYIGSFDGRIYAIGSTREETEKIPVYRNIIPIIITLIMLLALSQEKYKG